MRRRDWVLPARCRFGAVCFRQLRKLVAQARGALVLLTRHCIAEFARESVSQRRAINQRRSVGGVTPNMRRRTCLRAFDDSRQFLLKRAVAERATNKT